MREILFRGKRTYNGEWVEGYLIGKGMTAACTTYYLRCDYKEFAVDHTTVGQYIGMRDKNGKRLFEGDIVRTKYGRICKVVWHGYIPVYDLIPIANFDSKAPDKHDLFHSENLEVIGNIYDNPQIFET